MPLGSSRRRSLGRPSSAPTAEAVQRVRARACIRDRREGQGRAYAGADARSRVDADAARGLRGGARAFVGRGTELELLQAIFRHAAEQGEPHVVTLIGDAGVGKTTLRAGALSAARSGAAVQRTGRSSPATSTYWALGEILREHLGILESDVAGARAPAARRAGDPRARARARPHRRRPPACRPRPLPGGVGRVPGRARRGNADGLARRGPALGRGSAARPARAGSRVTPAARCS